MGHYLDFLNAEQLAVLDCDARSLLVMSGAGTGKTTLIAYKAADLVMQGVPPSRIALLTVSNNAEKRLLSVLEGLEAKIGVSLPRPTTIASLCYRQLKEVYSRGFGSMEHLDVWSDENDPRLVDVLLEAMAESPQYLPQDEFLPEQPPSPTIANAKALFDTLFRLKSIGGAKLAQALNNDEDFDLESLAVQYNESLMMMACVKSFEVKRKRKGFMTLPDMLIECADIYWKQPESRKFLVRYDYIAIDEGADLNWSMLGCVRSCLRVTGKLMIVGDPNQGVFGKIGADGVFLARNVKRAMPDTQIVAMNVNYRYGNNLARRLHRLPMHIEGRFSSATEHVTRIQARALLAPERIAHIKKLIEMARSHSESLAVLARTRSELFDLEMALIHDGVGSRALGIEPFAYNNVVQSFVALLGAATGWLDRMDACQRRDLIMSVAELFFPEWPVANRRETREMLDSLGPVIGNGFYYVMITLKGAAHFSPETATYQKRIEALTLFLERSQGEMRAGTWMSRKPSAVLQSLDILSLLKKSMLDADDCDDAVAMYHMLTDSDRPYCQSIDAFLGLYHKAHRVYASTYRKYPGKTGGKNVPALSTFLRAKGAEFDNVIIWDASDGLVPRARRSDLLDAKQQRRLEVNLFHIAVTRTRRALYLFHNQDGMGEFAKLLMGDQTPLRRDVAKRSDRHSLIHERTQKGAGYEAFKEMANRMKAKAELAEPESS